MTPQTFEQAFDRVKQLASVFQQNEKQYLSASYSEAQARLDFIDKFWIALGWDVNHEHQTNPYEQEVKVERGVSVSAARKRADYAFLAPNFRDVLFYVEAKKPRTDIDTTDNYFQTIRYGWNSQTPLAVLTDFEQFRVLDCRYKPNVEASLQRAVLKFHYTDYLDAEKFREIYHLFSREAVTGGSLEKFAAALPKPTGRGKQRSAVGVGYQSIDESFLQELDGYRDELARSFKNRNPHLNSEELTEVTQRTLDRLVFMRFLEDKLIEPEPLVERLGKKGTVWQDFVATSQRLDAIYNGIIFKRHALLDAPDFQVDERVFAGIRESLAHTNSPYDFNAIPIHILGSIYERFLGKVIIATDKRARIEEKPEVRKAGGVYYTPGYIVTYIVENTVGRLIEGRTPEQIALMRFADIACGSGSFLLGVYDYLLRYHTAYYNEQKNRARALKAGCVEMEDGALRLSLRQRKDILLNNIYGVDLDAQAVEVAQLSLFLKLLEDETTASARGHQLEFRETMLPSLDKNIIHGNSLIGWDILDGQLFDSEEERRLYPLDFEDKFKEIMKRGGFDAIVGNPPYIRIQTLQETTPLSVSYFKKRYAAASKGNYDIYVVFIERALQLLNERGRLGYIVPHKFFNAQYGAPLRKFLSDGKHLSHVVHFGDAQVFKGATTYTCLLFADKSARDEMRLVRVKDLSAWQETQAGDEGTISATRITPDEWNFTIGKGAGLFEKLSEMPTKLGDVADVFVGLQTSADDVFIMDFVAEDRNTLLLRSKALGIEWTFEKDLLFPVVSGTDVKRYEDLPERQFILFPYRVKDEVAKLIPFEDILSKQAKTADYLLANKNRLEGRERGKFKGKDWYRFGRSQNLGIQERVKLCVPRLVESLYAAFDTYGNHFLDNVDVGGITWKADFQEQSLKYLLATLNSKILRWYFPFVSAPFRGGWLSANRQFLSQLPIRTINFSDKADRARHDKMVTLVEQMLQAKQQLAAARSDRDKSFYENKCAALDRQIDALVYELYDLTPDEIALVEG